MEAPQQLHNVDLLVVALSVCSKPSNVYTQLQHRTVQSQSLKPLAMSPALSLTRCPGVRPNQDRAKSFDPNCINKQYNLEMYFYLCIV